MKKSVILIIAVLVVAVLVVGAVALLKKDNKAGGASKFETVEDITKLVEDIYEKTKIGVRSLETRKVDLDDEYGLMYATGLSSNENVEYAVVSEPMMSSIAYSLVVVKVKEGANVETVKQEMVDNIDTSKWICVTADALYATNYEDVIFLVMSSEENAKPQYDAFKTIVGNKVGQELTK